jgi:hypothetical protein
VPSIHDTATDIYNAIKDDPASIAELIETKNALAKAIFKDGNASGLIRSGTMNGSSFTMSDAIPPRERLKIMGIALVMLNAGQVASKTVTQRFV